MISEIIKSYYNKGIIDPPLYFYRDKDMNEIDLLIEENGTLYPLEMKNTLTRRKRIWTLSTSWIRSPVSGAVQAA